MRISWHLISKKWVAITIFAAVLHYLAESLNKTILQASKRTVHMITIFTPSGKKMSCMYRNSR